MTIIRDYGSMQRYKLLQYDCTNSKSNMHIKFKNRKCVRLNLKNKISFPTHRSGWSYALDSLECIRDDEKGIYVDDFIERTFSWGRPPIEKKKVNLGDRYWSVDHDDLRKCGSPRSIGLTHCVKVENDLIIRWCQINLQWEKYDITDDEYKMLELAYRPPIYYNIPWIGMWHNPPDIRAYVASNDIIHAPHYLFQRKEFMESLRFCKGIFVFSETMAQWLRHQFKSLSLIIPVSALYHPTEKVASTKMFTQQKFIDNGNKKILQIGSWLRDSTAIFKLKTIYKKVWICRDTDALIRFCDDINLIENSEFAETAKKIKHILDSGYEYNIEYPLTNDVYLIKLDNDDYDRYLENNIVLTKIKGSSCNNGIIECIARGTPIFVNKLDAVIEYLGEDYPLYYDNIADVENILKEMTSEKIMNAHRYLTSRCPTKDKLSGEYFKNELLSSDVISSLLENFQKPNWLCPPPQQKTNKGKLDFVIQWMSSDSQKWINAKKRDVSSYLDKTFVCDSRSESRFRDIFGRLKYCLRSVESACGDIIRNIYIVVHDDQELPLWLNANHKNLFIIRHSDIFSHKFNKKYSSYNSLSVETQIHKIPNITDTFVYLNDNMFLLGKWTLDDFVSKNGKIMFYHSNGEIGRAYPSSETAGFEHCWHNIHNELNAMFPKNKNEFRPTLDNAPYVINRQTAKRLNRLKSVKATSTSLIRVKDDISLLTGLSQYVEYYNRCAYPKRVKVTYVTPEKLSKDKICAVPPEARILSLQSEIKNQLPENIISDVVNTLNTLFNTPSKWE